MQSGKGTFRRSSIGLALVGGMWLCCRIACADLWVTGYYPGYRQGYLPPAMIDFTTVSHVIHFSLGPNADGSLNTNLNGITPAYSADLVSRARSRQKGARLCGWRRYRNRVSRGNGQRKSRKVHQQPDELHGRLWLRWDRC
jgi:hypothetical protein